MLRFIFICLLIANMLLFALWRGYVANPVFELRQPQRLLQQQAASHLKLISADEATAPAKPEIKEPAMQETFACLEWGPFSEPVRDLFGAAKIRLSEDRLRRICSVNI